MTILGEALAGVAGAGVKKLAEKALEEKKPARRKQQEDKLAKALVSLRRERSERSEDPALEEFREDLFAELRKLIRPAIAQAKKGKPALLRILTRYTR